MQSKTKFCTSLKRQLKACTLLLYTPQAWVVQKMDKTTVCFVNICSMDSDLSSG